MTKQKDKECKRSPPTRASSFKGNPQTVVHGDVIRWVVEGISAWLDMKGGRIIGMVDGQIIVAFEDKEYRELYEEFFKEEKDDSNKKESA